MDRYQVKWASIGPESIRGYEYGTIGWKQEEYELEVGYVAVDHGILPNWFSIKESEIIDVESKEYYKYLDEAYDRAVMEAMRQPKGVLTKGKLFNVHVADGCAVYIVTRVNKKTCNVEWRGYGNADHYTDQILGDGMKSVPRDRIEDQVAWFDKQQEFYSKHPFPKVLEN